MLEPMADVPHPVSDISGTQVLKNQVFKPSNESERFHCMLRGKGFAHELALNLHVKEAHEVQCSKCDEPCKIDLMDSIRFGLKTIPNR